ncbi:MAG: hypothetical protein A3F40_00580 [Chlamydiae bacterium RIFCSPHIGHO2_12_FULL_27_8]|nr:MAG: hypothetical protein A3F40_00580 [Chlamydiae bacterium RIFCSPHIGHO2_12_FULL_27_8]OGN66389.1 MAG: hypothetical protein A2888_02895 [Chlamydiae bacterium RIFCSPLOWO2_01_FULL_28_7]
MKTITKIFLLLVCGSNLFSCTDFIIENKLNNYIVGRSMEFGLPLQSKIEVFQKKQKFISKIEDKTGMEFNYKYSFIAVTSFDHFVTDGMNEKGLSFGILWFQSAKYPENDLSNLKNVLALEDIGNWILSSFQNIDELKNGLKKIKFYVHKIKDLNEIVPIHVSIHDANGKSLVVEFINEKIEISENAVGVLTNEPKLEWHVTNLSNFINLDAMNKASIIFDGTVIDPTGQGSGLLGLPGDWTPPSRFIRTAFMKNFIIKPKTDHQTVNLAFHLLNAVDIPYGAIRTKDGKNYEFTRWVVVKDLKNKKLFYRTYKDLIINEINVIDAIKANKSIPMIGTDL